jgi:hypothetical protein
VWDAGFFFFSLDVLAMMEKGLALTEGRHIAVLSLLAHLFLCPANLLTRL